MCKCKIHTKVNWIENKIKIKSVYKYYCLLITPTLFEYMYINLKSEGAFGRNIYFERICMFFFLYQSFTVNTFSLLSMFIFVTQFILLISLVVNVIFAWRVFRRRIIGFWGGHRTLIWSAIYVKGFQIMDFEPFLCSLFLLTCIHVYAKYLSSTAAFESWNWKSKHSNI